MILDAAHGRRESTTSGCGYRLFVSSLINVNWRIKIAIFFDSGDLSIRVAKPGFVSDTTKTFIPTNRIYDQVIRLIV